MAPLGLPGADVRTEVDLLASPAGALVLDRARAVAPGSVVGTEDLHALAELCRRLAGLPLAIELATARLRLLDPVTLVGRLDVLGPTVGARDLPARQRTMRATLDWSHGLLGPDEQTLLRVLGVFRSPATLGSVEEVVGPEVPPGQVVGLLAALVEHSLVQVRTGPDGGRRYAMLEPVAQYARSLLVGEQAERAARRHAAVFLGHAERAAVGYEREEQVAWLARTEAVEADLLVAVERSLLLGDGRTAACLVWAMWLYWWLRGQTRPGAGWPSTCSTRPGRGCPTTCAPGCTSRPRPWPSRAGTSRAPGSTGTPRWPSRSRSTTPTRRPRRSPAPAWPRWPRATWPPPRTASGRRCPWPPRPARTGCGCAPWCTSGWGPSSWPAATWSARSSRPASVSAWPGAAGDRLSTYVALYGLARAAVAGDDPVAARAHLQEGIRLSEQTRDYANLAYFLDMLAVVEAAEGEPARVALLLGAAQALRETVGSNVYGYYLPDAAQLDGAAAAARAALGDDRFEDALDAGRSLDPDAVVALALERRSPPPG